LEFVTIAMSDNSRAIIEKPEHHNLESLYLPEFLLRQRWFGAKDASIAHIEMHTLGIFESEAAYHLNIIDVELDSGEAQQYFLPLSIERGDSNPPDVSAFIDATRDEVFVRKLVNSIWSDQAIGTPYGTLRFIKSGGWDSIPPGAMVRSVSSEQTNDSFIVDERVVLKIYRRLWKGAQPEPEIATSLVKPATETHPPFLV
jgi:maltose alpha-D-glucosyltransferase/alpha-amylase